MAVETINAFIVGQPAALAHVAIALMEGTKSNHFEGYSFLGVSRIDAKNIQ
jgi:hypothetical protein